MNSAGVRKGTREAAHRAADKAFSHTSALPLDESRGGTAEASLGRRRLAGAFFIELERIQPDPGQPRRRLDTDAQRELTDSVRQMGILQSITVRFLEAENVYRIISGERRFHAAGAAGLLEMPCWVQSPQANDILLHQLVENWQRADLAPFEIADALLALKESNGYTQKKLAEAVGKSEAEVSKLLSLFDLDTSAQDLARGDASGRFSRRHLLAAAKLPGPEQRVFLERVRDTDVTAAQAEEFVHAAATSKQNSAPKRGAPVTRIRFTTKEATVLLTFRRKSVTPEMIANVLDDVRKQLKDQPTNELKIIRAK